MARARLKITFRETARALDRWRCSRCQRYARNKLTLTALKRTACEPLYVLREGLLHQFRECTRLTEFDVQDRSRGAPCAGPTAQTAALRCVNIAQESVPLTQGASVCVSWSLAITRLLERGCWMRQLSPCRFFVRALMFVRWH